MTTIAYKAGVLASDSCWAVNDIQQVSATKIKRLSSGALIGLSGDNDARDVYALFDKVKCEKQFPTRTQMAAVRGEFAGLLVLPNGKTYCLGMKHDEKAKEEDFGIWEVNRGVAVSGSGGEVALGAMRAGKSAREAVAIACGEDINSRLPVHSIALNPKPIKKRARP